MKLKKVCLCLFVLLFLLLLSEIACIANHLNTNLISDEDRRGAEAYEQDAQKGGAIKRGLYGTSGTQSYHHGYPSAEASFSSPGYSYYPSEHSSFGLIGSHGHSGGAYGGFGHSGGAYGGFGHSGGGYAHTAPSHGHGHNGLALKGLLIPLAGIALLGAAAALSTNPVLLQLGVVNGRRRRRRRSTDLNKFKFH